MRLADASGAVIRPYFRKPLAVGNKAGAGGFDPVTAADRAAERVIAAAVAARWPDHGFIGEEFGTHAAGRPPTLGRRSRSTARAPSSWAGRCGAR